MIKTKVGDQHQHPVKVMCVAGVMMDAFVASNSNISSSVETISSDISSNNITVGVCCCSHQQHQSNGIINNSAISIIAGDHGHVVVADGASSSSAAATTKIKTAKAATAPRSLLYSVDETPPWHLSILLGFQVITSSYSSCLSE